MSPGATSFEQLEHARGRRLRAGLFQIGAIQSNQHVARLNARGRGGATRRDAGDRDTIAAAGHQQQTERCALVRTRTGNRDLEGVLLLPRLLRVQLLVQLRQLVRGGVEPRARRVDFRLQFRIVVGKRECGARAQQQ